MSEHKRRSFFFGLNKSSSDDQSTPAQQQTRQLPKKTTHPPPAQIHAKNTNPFVTANSSNHRKENGSSFKTFSVVRADSTAQDLRNANNNSNQLQQQQVLRPDLNRSSSSSYTTYTNANVTAKKSMANAPSLPSTAVPIVAPTFTSRASSMSRPPPPPVDMVFVRNVSNKSDKTLTGVPSSLDPATRSSSVYTSTTGNMSPNVEKNLPQFTNQRKASHADRMREFSDASAFSNQSSQLRNPMKNHKRERSQVEIYIDQLDSFMKDEEVKKHAGAYQDDDSENLSAQLEGNRANNPFYDENFKSLNKDQASRTKSKEHNDFSANHSNDENSFDNASVQNDHFSPVKPLYKKDNSGTFSQYVEPFEMEPPFLNSTLSNLALDSPSKDPQNDSFHTAQSNDDSLENESDQLHLSGKHSSLNSARSNDYINNQFSPDNPFAGDNKPLYPEPIRLINTNSSEDYDNHAQENNGFDQYSFDNSIVESQLPRKHESVKEMQNVSIIHSSSDEMLGSERKEQRFRVINQDRPSFYVNHDEDDDEDDVDDGAAGKAYYGHKDAASFTYQQSEHTPPLYYKSSTNSTSSLEYDQDEHESSLLDADSALKTSMHSERADSNIGRNSFISNSSFPAKADSDQKFSNGRPRLHTQQISTASFKFPSHGTTEDHEINGETSETTSSLLPHDTPKSAQQSKYKPFVETERNPHLVDQESFSSDHYVPAIPETPIAPQIPESVLSSSSGDTSGQLDSSNLSPVTRSATLTTGALRDTGGKISLVSEYVEELRYKYFPTANVVQPPPNLPLSIKSKNTLELPQSSNIKVKIRTSSKQIGIKHGKAKQKLLSLEAPAEEDEYSDVEDPLNISFNGNEGYIPTAEEEEERLILSELPGDEAYNGDDLMAPLRERNKTINSAKNGNARVSRSDSTKSYFTKNAHRFRSGTLDNSYVPPMGNFGKMGALPQLPSNQAIPLYKENVITDPVTPTSSNMSGYNKNSLNDDEVMKEIEKTYRKPTNDFGKSGLSNLNTNESKTRTNKHGSLVSADFYHQDLNATGSSLKVANPDHEY